mmetsp:Transcript_9655/g.15117  ORF Transcript_9655/g.15117 Transcript_9655/m.15117 type:complete len:397 (+) Transcript_9655:74-1264(+)
MRCLLIAVFVGSWGAEALRSSACDGMLFSSKEELRSCRLLGSGEVRGVETEGLENKGLRSRGAEDPFSSSAVETLRAKEAKLSGYRNSWLLQYASDSSAPGVVARMEMDWEVIDGTYRSGMKSIVDDARGRTVIRDSIHIMEVRGFEQTALLFEVEEDNGFTFVRWSFSSPLKAGDTVTVKITYVIDQTVCYREENGLKVEEFEAMFANYWRIEVEHINYEFMVPGGPEDWALGPYLVEPLESELEAEESVFLGVEVLRQSNPLTASELGIGMNPNNVKYRWARADGSSPAEACGGWGSLIAPIVGVLAGVVVAVALGCFLGCRKGASPETQTPNLQSANPTDSYSPPVAVPLQSQGAGPVVRAIPAEAPQTPVTPNGPSSGGFWGVPRPTAPPMT